MTLAQAAVMTFGPPLLGAMLFLVVERLAFR